MQKRERESLKYLEINASKTEKEQIETRVVYNKKFYFHCDSLNTGEAILFLNKPFLSKIGFPNRISYSEACF